MAAKRKKTGKSIKQTGGKAPPAKRQVHSGGTLARWLTTPSRAALVVFVVSIVLYTNTLGHDFAWDDYSLIVDNQAVRTLDAQTLRSIFGEDSWRVAGRGGGYYRPLVTLSYHIQYEVFNGNPSGFHWVNLLWNAVTCVLVFAFINLLFGSVVLGLITALLFAVHPIHTEAVAWISGRTDVLAALWSLVSLSLYVLARRRGNHLLLLGSLVAFMLAMFAKESAACLPLLILLLEVGPFDALIASRPGAPQRPGRFRWTRSIVVSALFLGALALYVMFRREVLGTTTSSYEAYAPGALGTVALPLSILAGYLHKVFLPLSLNAEYEAAVPTSFAEWPVIAGAVITALIAWSVWRFRHRPDVVLGIGIFLFGLAPVANVVPIGEVSAERFLYFPSLGIALILGSIFATALAAKYPSLQGLDQSKTGVRWRMSTSVAGNLIPLLAIVLVAAAGRTVARNGDWRDEQTLFAKTVTQESNNPRVHANLAQAAQRSGDLPGATRAYQRSLEINPDYPVALSNLAEIYARQGKYDDALALVQRAIRASPDDPKLVNNLGSLYYQTGEYAKAAQQFETALRLNPDELRAHFNLGLIHLQQGNAATARGHFEAAARGGPDFNIANYHLAVIDYTAGNKASAKQYAQQFLALYRADDDLRRRAEAIARGD
jgi:tetratricopeptide (TPR) repeat protein